MPNIKAGMKVIKVSLSACDSSRADQEAMADLPVNNLWIVMPALGLMVFISALDNTVSTL